MSRFLPELEVGLGADLTRLPSLWSWWSYTDHVWMPSKITGGWGRQDRYSQTQPARLSLTLINPAGIWVPDNATGPLYGLIDLNTPIRVLNRPLENTAADTFARTASSSWGSADTGGAWTNTGGAASDFSVASASGGRHLHTAANTRHASQLAVSLVRSDQTVSIRVNALSTGAAQSAGLAFRRVDASNSCRGEVQFGVGGAITARLVQTVAAVDTVRASAQSTLTHSTASWYRLRVQTGLTSVRVKVWLAGTDEPRNWLVDGAQAASVSVTTAGTCGPTSIRETSNTNANATIDFDDYALLDGPYIVQTTLVDAWPTEWSDISGVQSLAPITGSGKLRQVNNAASLSLKSAAFRAHTLQVYSSAPVAVAYWPMEDAYGAGQFASGLSGGPPMMFTAMSPGGDSTIAGSDPLPTGSSTATFSARVPSYPPATTWAVRALLKLPIPSVSTAVLAWTTGGTISKWALSYDAATAWTLQGYIGITEVLALGTASFSDVYGGTMYNRQIYMAADATQNGSNIDYTVTLWTDNSGITLSGSYAGTIGNVAQIFHSAYPGLTLSSYTIGHVAVATDAAYNNSNAVASGYAGESTSTRFLRLCEEENIPGYVGEILGVGSVNSTQLMGPQRTTGMAAQLREIEATELGILFDGRQGQTTLLPRSLRGNHTVGLVLDIDAGHVAWPFRRTIDDQLLVNDVTVSRPGGSKAYANDPVLVRKVGVKPDAPSVNTDSDVSLVHHARFRLHAGTNREARYPSLSLNFGRNPDLIRSWLEADVGSRATITGLPGELPPDDLDLLLEGGQNVMDDFSWLATANFSPASIWDLWTVADTLRGRVAPSRTAAGAPGSQLHTAATAGATSVLFATLAGRPWSTTATPYHTRIAGEQVTVTAMAASAQALVAAGTAVHGDNASLTPSLPSGLMPGDLALIFTAIRNTAATIATPAGWTALLTAGNVAVYGRIMDGYVETFEAGVTGWAATGGAVTSSSAQAHSGTKSGLLTVSGSPVLSYIRTEQPVTPGVAYHLSLWVYSVAGYADVGCGVDWYDAAHGYISTSTSGGSALGAAGWANRSVTAAAPANAWYAQIGPTLGSSPPNGTAVFTDDVLFDRAAVLTYAGGSAGDTTSAHAAAFRYTQCRALYTASQSNGSAQNIAIPAMLPPQHRVIALWLGWKADDWTSVATLFGTEIGEPSTTTGSDQGLVWDYQVQTIAAETAVASFVVTGGANAVSKGLVLVLPGDVQAATVTRAVNGVAKAQLAGAPIELWKPGVLEL